MIVNERLTKVSELKQYDRFKFREGKKLYIFSSFTPMENPLYKGQVLYIDNHKVRGRKAYPFKLVFKQTEYKF